MVQFVDPMFRFVDEALVKGGGILLHCIAGAHRAGTTGVACLMHLTGATPASATQMAQRIRKVSQDPHEALGASQDPPAALMRMRMRMVVTMVTEMQEGDESHGNAASIYGEAPHVASLKTLTRHWELLRIPQQQ
eukprot:gene6340-2965_t